MNNSEIAKTAHIRENVIIGDNVIIEDNCFIDYGAIIRDNVHIKKNSFIGARCIIGEYSADFFHDKVNKVHPLVIGENAVIRSETIIYGDITIGDNFKTGHNATIAEGSIIGNNVKLGTGSEIFKDCIVEDYVSIHSRVILGEKSVLKKFVWILPQVVLTSDFTPPSNALAGPTIESYAVISAGCIILPAINIGEGALVGAGSIVTKNVDKETVVVGNPAKKICLTKDIKNKLTGQQTYPWKYTFSRGMPWDEIGYEEWEKSKK